MLVYRVELPDGTGPWCNADGNWHSYQSGQTGYTAVLSSWSCPISIDFEIHRKFSLDAKGTWRFGFTNFRSFFQYCLGGTYSMRRIEKHRALELIKEKGMSISVYEIDDSHVMADARQCVFRIAEARLIERLDALSDTILEQLNVHCI